MICSELILTSEIAPYKNILELNISEQKLIRVLKVSELYQILIYRSLILRKNELKLPLIEVFLIVVSEDSIIRVWETFEIFLKRIYVLSFYQIVMFFPFDRLVLKYFMFYVLPLFVIIKKNFLV